MMLSASERSPEVKNLCAQITAKVAAIRALYDASAATKFAPTDAPPRAVRDLRRLLGPLTNYL
jgi:hypothetical protein